MKKKFKTQNAFSLVEVVAAVGVVAIGIIAILGLLPSGLNSSRDTANETRAALMAQSVYTTLRSQPFDKVNLFSSSDDFIDLRSQNGSLRLYSDINGSITNIENAESVFFLDLDFNNNPTNFPSVSPSRVNQVSLNVTWLPTNSTLGLKFVSFIGNMK